MSEPIVPPPLAHKFSHHGTNIWRDQYSDAVTCNELPNLAQHIDGVGNMLDDINKAYDVIVGAQIGVRKGAAHDGQTERNSAGLQPNRRFDTVGLPSHLKRLFNQNSATGSYVQQMPFRLVTSNPIKDFHGLHSTRGPSVLARLL